MSHIDILTKIKEIENRKEKQKQLEKDIEDKKEELQLNKKVEAKLSYSVEKIRKQSAEILSGIVNQGLSCFEMEKVPDFRIDIPKEKKNNKIVADLSLGSISLDRECDGIKDLASLSSLLASKYLDNQNKGPMILDEVLKFVSPNNQILISDFLKNYAEYSGQQIFFATNKPSLTANADKVYQFKNKEVTEIENI